MVMPRPISPRILRKKNSPLKKILPQKTPVRDIHGQPTKEDVAIVSHPSVIGIPSFKKVSVVPYLGNVDAEESMA